jgi:RNA polymerase sigma factor (sigma-70 family)
METINTIQMNGVPGQKTILAIKEYGNRLFRFIRGKVSSNEDAEDILQDIWVQLTNHIDVEEIGQLSGWLYQVARNKITDRYRKKKPQALEDYSFTNSEGEIDWIGIMTEEPSNPETEFLHELFWEEFSLALDELPEKQKKVFIMNELEDISLQEIADQEGENLKTIISRKMYALRRLRERLSVVYHEFMEN